MPNEQPPPKPWYKSSQIMTALSLLVPALLTIVKLFHWDKLLHIDLSAVDVDEVKDIFVALLAGIGGVYWMIKRVLAGKKKQPQPAAIETPAVVTMVTTAVERLTGG